MAQNATTAFLECRAALELRSIFLLADRLDNSFTHLSNDNVRDLLVHTIKHDYLDGARCLFDHGAVAGLVNPFMMALHCKSVAILELFSQHGMVYRDCKHNLLSRVVFLRDILDWLLDYGLDINGPTNDVLYRTDSKVIRDNTVDVLNQAAGAGDIELFDHLVARGAKPEHSNALHNAARAHQHSAAMINHLVDKYHMDVNAGDDCNGLNELVTWDIPAAAQSHHATPLAYATKACNLEAVEALLRHGASPVGVEAITTAVAKRQPQIIKVLLEHGADASKGLASAVVQDYLEGAKLCLEFGADIAHAEEHDRFVSGINPAYQGMSIEMRTLLNNSKARSI